jgi:hypothetical protein
LGAAQTADPVIAKLNNSYALVLTGGRTAILKEGVSEEERAEGSLISVEAFTQWHANRHLLDIAYVQLREIYRQDRRANTGDDPSAIARQACRRGRGPYITVLCDIINCWRFFRCE